MNRAQALNILPRLRAPLAARGISHAAFCGSVARGEEGARSDIDVFVTPAEGSRLGLFDPGGIQTILEDAFGTDVDLVVDPVTTPGLLPAIEKDRADAFGPLLISSSARSSRPESGTDPIIRFRQIGDLAR